MNDNGEMLMSLIVHIARETGIKEKDLAKAITDKKTKKKNALYLGRMTLESAKATKEKTDQENIIAGIIKDIEETL